MVRSLLLSLCVVLVALVAASHGAVLGIDFGSQFLKMALVKPGTPFDIVTDEHSKRKLPTIVGFLPKERLFGNGAMALVSARVPACSPLRNSLRSRSHGAKQCRGRPPPPAPECVVPGRRDAHAHTYAHRARIGAPLRPSDSSMSLLTLFH